MACKTTEGFVTVNGVSTNVITWGGWIEDKLNEDQKELILLIPGNPGSAGYYTTFLTKLHSQLGVPIWAVSHAGHVLPPPTRQNLPPLEQNPDLYNLEGQVEHKLAFIEKYVPKNVKLILIGHSIGAKIILEMLKNSEIKSRVMKAYLLFPTIERMALSPNGKIITGIVKHLIPTMLFLAWVFTILPVVVQKFLLAVHFMVRRMPTYHVTPTMNLVHPTVLQNVMFLALDEMEKVKELDEKGLKEASSLLFLYYGTTDGWVPLDYWKDMTRKHFDVKCMLCENKFDHAFVLRYSNEMADIMSDLIKEHTQLN
ncbi:lipid droplet-associated hydrolase-like [Periplaneta americana]